MDNPVTGTPAAASGVAAAHFESSLSFETDCWDTHFALPWEEPGFVLLDVRSPDHFAAGLVPGTINLPHAKIISGTMARWPSDTLFVTYWASPQSHRLAEELMSAMGKAANKPCI